MARIENPLVSIIIPTFNRAQFLERAIGSILSQTYKNLELIVVDGASTDGSLEILKKLSKEDSRLRYLSEPDEGEVYATNKGIDMATGDIIGFQASDDYYVSDAVESSVNFLLKNREYDAVSGDAALVDARGNYIGVNARTYRGRMEKSQIKTILRMKPGSSPLNHGAFFGWSDCIRSNGKFNPDFSVTPDLEFYLRFLSNGYQIGCIPKVQVNYTLHEGMGAVKYRNKVNAQYQKITQQYGFNVFDQFVGLTIGKALNYLSNPFRIPLGVKIKAFMKGGSIYEEQLRIYSNRQQ